MSKTVRRIRPFGSGDIPAVQRWLEDMAEKGLLFKECGLLFAKFTKGEPKKMRYRLDFCDVVACDIPDEKKELYEQSGWQVVGDYNSDLVVVCTDEPDAPEIYTDPELLVKPLKKISDKLLASWIVFWLLSGWVDFGTLTTEVILGDSSFVRYLLDFNTLYFIGLCLLSLLLLFEAIYHFIGWLRVRKLVKKLKNGEELPRGERRSFRAAVGKILCPLAVPAVILWGVHLFFIGYPIGLNMGEPIKDLGSMPFPTPAELGIACGAAAITTEMSTAMSSPPRWPNTRTAMIITVKTRSDTRCGITICVLSRWRRRCMQTLSQARQALIPSNMRCLPMKYTNQIMPAAGTASICRR